jgi:hypothetical protein
MTPFYPMQIQAPRYYGKAKESAAQAEKRIDFPGFSGILKLTPSADFRLCQTAMPHGCSHNDFSR